VTAGLLQVFELRATSRYYMQALDPVVSRQRRNLCLAMSRQRRSLPRVMRLLFVMTETDGVGSVIVA